MDELQVVDKGIFNFFSFLGESAGCGHIRVIFPYLYFPHLRSEDYKFGSQYSSYYIDDMNFYKQFTLVQFQRAATGPHLTMVKHFKNRVQKFLKIALIYEIDDLLTDIPEWNFASTYYKENLKNVEEMMRTVNGITVSTEYLKNIYKEYNKNIVVTPNHLPKIFWGEIEPAHLRSEPNKKIRIGYHGSGNHFCDKRSKEYANGIRGGDFNDKLLDFIRKTANDVQWVFTGAMPPELDDVKDKIEYHNWVNVLEFPRAIKSHKLDICLAPLVNNVFNRCKCLVGNTLTVSNRGIDILSNLSNKDKIWQKDSYKNILETIKYKDRETIKIKTKMGYEVEGTVNHRININNEFVMLKDLKIGDFIDLHFFEYPKLKYQELSIPLFLTKKIDSIDFEKLNNDLLPKLIINERWGRFIGYVLGDGHLSTSNSVSISCDKKYNDIIDDIKKFGEEIGVKTFCSEKRKEDDYKGNGVDVIFSSRNLKWILGKYIGFEGRYCKNLKVPDIILKSPKNVIKEFIRGLFETDGTVGQTSCSFTTKDEILVKQIQFLLLGFNIFSKIVIRYDKKYNKNYYTLKLNRQASEIFYNEINFISNEKINKLKNNISKKHSNAYKEWNKKDEIVEIIESINDVYDIQIPDGECYFANGVLSHNSNIKLLESVGLGIPIVCSDLEPYEKSYLKTNDDDEFVGYIEKLIKEQDFRQLTFEKNYDNIINELWWEGTGKYENVYRYVDSYLSLFNKRLKDGYM